MSMEEVVFWAGVAVGMQVSQHAEQGKVDPETEEKVLVFSSIFEHSTKNAIVDLALGDIIVRRAVSLSRHGGLQREQLVAADARARNHDDKGDASEPVDWLGRLEPVSTGQQHGSPAGRGNCADGAGRDTFSAGDIDAVASRSLARCADCESGGTKPRSVGT